MAGKAKAIVPKRTKVNGKEKYAKDIKVATSNLFVDISKIPFYTDILAIALQDLNSGEIVDYGDNRLFLGDGSAGTFSGNPIQSGIMKSSSLISDQYNPRILLSNKNYQEDYTNSFAYSLDSYTPIVGTGNNGEVVYVDESNNIVINTVNVQDFQEIEIEFWNYDLEINDTIIE
jgi:hypothetical protein